MAYGDTEGDNDVSQLSPSVRSARYSRFPRCTPRQPSEEIAPTDIAGKFSSSFLLPDDIASLIKCILADLETWHGLTREEVKDENWSIFSASLFTACSKNIALAEMIYFGNPIIDVKGVPNR